MLNHLSDTSRVMSDKRGYEQQMKSTIVGSIAPLERLLDEMLEGFGMVNEPLL